MQRHVLVAKIVLLVFLIVFSFFVASTKSVELPLYKNSIQTLDDSKSMVVNYSSPKGNGLVTALWYSGLLLPHLVV